MRREQYQNIVTQKSTAVSFAQRIAMCLPIAGMPADRAAALLLRSDGEQWPLHALAQTFGESVAGILDSCGVPMALIARTVADLRRR